MTGLVTGGHGACYYSVSIHNIQQLSLRLRALLDRGKTQAEIARGARVSQPTVSRVLSQTTGHVRTSASINRLFIYAELSTEEEVIPEQVLEQVRSIQSSSPAAARALACIVRALSDLSAEDSLNDSVKPKGR